MDEIEKNENACKYALYYTFNNKIVWKNFSLKYCDDRKKIKSKIKEIFLHFCKKLCKDTQKLKYIRDIYALQEICILDDVRKEISKYFFDITVKRKKSVDMIQLLEYRNYIDFIDQSYETDENLPYYSQQEKEKSIERVMVYCRYKVDTLYNLCKQVLQTSIAN